MNNQPQPSPNMNMMGNDVKRNSYNRNPFHHMNPNGDRHSSQ